MGIPTYRSVSTRKNLIEATREAAFAFAQCKLLAQQVRKRGCRKLANLLERTADQHYLKHFAAGSDLLGLSTVDCRNISALIREESLVLETLCKMLAREAKHQGDNKAARQLAKMRDDELIHRLRMEKDLSGLPLRSKAKPHR